MNRRYLLFPALILLFILPLAVPVYAQLEREPAVTDRPVDLTFLSSRNISIYTVEPIARGELHSSVMHAFGEVNTGIGGFWGLDAGANIRLGLEYGIGDGLSVALGRSALDKVVDMSFRAALLRQTSSDRTPVSVSLVPSLGINTDGMDFLTEEYSFSERLNYALSLPIARKLNRNLSLQVAPIVVHFNRVGTELVVADPTVNTYYSVAFAGRLMISQQSSLSVQYIPPLTDAENMSGNFAVGLDINTGGHVFQVFFTTSQGLTQQYVVAGPNGSFFDREFRFGFNINRVFQLIGD